MTGADENHDHPLVVFAIAERDAHARAVAALDALDFTSPSVLGDFGDARDAFADASNAANVEFQKYVRVVHMPAGRAS